METKQNSIGFYCELNVEKRMDYIYKNYSNYGNIIESYRQGLIFMIHNQKIYNRRQGIGELLIRIQSGTMNKSLTEDQAIENVIIKECVDEKKITDALLADVDNPEKIKLGIFELDLMKREYDLFSCQIKLLDSDDCEILYSYLKRKKDIYDIAKDLIIEPESVHKRLYRLKKKLINLVKPFVQVEPYKDFLTDERM